MKTPGDLGVPKAMRRELGDALLGGCQCVGRAAPPAEPAFLGLGPGDPEGVAERLERPSSLGELLGGVAAPAEPPEMSPVTSSVRATRSVVRLAEDRSKPATAAVGSVTVARTGARSVARVKYTASGIACPVQLSATASLSGGALGQGERQGGGGQSTLIEIPLAKAPSSGASATSKIVLKTNGRPTTQTAAVRLG